MYDVLKPYVVLACVAFFAGFAGYLALGRTLAPVPAAEPWQAQISAPSLHDDAPLARARRI